MKIIKFWKTILWAGLIVYLTAFTGNNFKSVRLFLHADKLVHVSLFMIFSFFLSLDLLKIYNKEQLYLLIIIAMIISVFLSISTELVQHYIISNRTGSIIDLTADIVGSALGLLCIKFYKIK